MRIWLRIPDERLRRALVDLLSSVGHETLVGSPPPASTDLQVVADPSDGAFVTGIPALCLRPAAGRSPDADPAGALRTALVTGGVATWRSPLDPGMLLDALRSPAASGSAPRPPPRPPEASLLGATDPWLTLDPRTRLVEWANGAARQVLALSFGPAGESAALPEALPPRILEQAQGGVRAEVSGRPFVATWWTTERGRRCVGLVPIPAAGTGAAPENLRTLAAIGRMTATFAHELRNPLASLAGALDLLDGDLHRDERREVATLARNRLQQMRRLLDDTLRLSRPLRGDPEPLDPRAIVETAAAEARLDPKFKGIAVRTEVPGFPVRAFGHEQALQQALANLLLNAAEAQEGRGTILVRLGVEGPWIVMRVEDEGPGIPAARREEVFGPFWTTKAGGTGLGLAYVRRVAEADGGRALIEASDRGACVRVDLPLAL